jgi:hypothetical protein
MSGRELDSDGTDSYHPQHPWEQVGHPLYLYPKQRTLDNWPPEAALPAGPAEAAAWRALPEVAAEPEMAAEWHNRGNCGPSCDGWTVSPNRRNFTGVDPCRCVCHRPRISA